MEYHTGTHSWRRSAHHDLNGNLTSEFTGDGKYANILLNRGSIALQVHGGRWCPKGLKARYRNIQIKEL